jgi:hypothetical protein
MGHNLYDTNAFSDKDVSSSMSHNDHNRDNATQRFDIILLHDSLCHVIDMRQFIGYLRRSGLKQVTYTATVALQYVDKIQHANTTILHVGISDLKKFSVGATFARYRTLVDEVLKKSESVALSLILPVGYVGLNKKVRELNDKIVSFYGNMDQVMISSNSNFADSSGRLNRTLYRDEIRLSVEHGVTVLASNLKRCVFRRHPRLLRSAPEHNRGPYKHENVNQSSSFTHNSYSQQDVTPR